MARLTHDEVRDIGIAAIRRVIGATFVDAELGYTFGAEDQAYYLFTMRFSSERAWRHAVSLSARMSQAISGDLWERGDEMFAFTRLLSDGTWDFRRDAAAE